MRKCGSCDLCCKLLPVDEGLAAERLEGGRYSVKLIGWHKMAGERCQHQKHGKGCSIYPNRPMACQTWSCRWLSDPDVGELQRPDRVGYVIDVVPDVGILHTEEEGGRDFAINTIQIWVDPARPRAHEDPALRRYLSRKWLENREVGSVRFNEIKGVTLFPPESNTGNKWVEKEWAAPGMGVDLDDVIRRARLGEVSAVNIVRKRIEMKIEGDLEEGEG